MLEGGISYLVAHGAAGNRGRHLQVRSAPRRGGRRAVPQLPSFPLISVSSAKLALPYKCARRKEGQERGEASSSFFVEVVTRQGNRDQKSASCKKELLVNRLHPCTAVRLLLGCTRSDPLGCGSWSTSHQLSEYTDQCLFLSPRGGFFSVKAWPALWIEVCLAPRNELDGIFLGRILDCSRFPSSGKLTGPEYSPLLCILMLFSLLLDVCRFSIQQGIYFVVPIT